MQSVALCPFSSPWATYSLGDDGCTVSCNRADQQDAGSDGLPKFLGSFLLWSFQPEQQNVYGTTSHGYTTSDSSSYQTVLL